MEIFVIRHGKTNWNEKGIIQGHSQNRLSKAGKLAVENAAELLKNTPIDVIFTSPLMRTMQTTNILNKYHKVTVIKDSRLIEIDQGDFTGVNIRNLTPSDREQRRLKSKKYHQENNKEVYTRVKDFFDQLKIQSYKSVLIVTHGICASILENLLTNVDITDFNDDKVFDNFDNAQIKKFTIS